MVKDRTRSSRGYQSRWEPDWLHDDGGSWRDKSERRDEADDRMNRGKRPVIPILSSSLANEGNQIFIKPHGSQNKHCCANIRLLILAQRQEHDTGRADNMAAGARLGFYSVLCNSNRFYSTIFYQNRTPICSIPVSSNRLYYIPIYSILFCCTLYYSVYSIQFQSLIIFNSIVLYYVLCHSNLFYFILFYAILFSSNRLCYIPIYSIALYTISSILYNSNLFCSIQFWWTLFNSIGLYYVLCHSILFSSIPVCSILFSSNILHYIPIYSIQFCCTLFCSVPNYCILFCSMQFCSVLFPYVLFYSCLIYYIILQYILFNYVAVYTIPVYSIEF